MDQNKNHKFCCPDELPAFNTDNNFCIPCNCPRQIPTKRFSSPNSGLSPEELERLKACIEKLNNILLSISSPRDPNNLVPLRNYFIRLKGILIRVYVECTGFQDNILGCLQEVGGDYLQLNSVGKKVFVPFSRICSIARDAPKDCESGHMHHQELNDIDPCLRRNLVLNFGETVASSPQLFNIFFGLPLHLRLLDFLNCRVMVKVEGEEQLLKGILICSEKDFIKIKTDENVDKGNEEEIKDNKKNEKIEKINFEDICFISIL